MSKANDSAVLGPLEALGSGAVPSQSNHDRAVATHSPGVTPTAVEDATFRGMLEIDPACGLLPHCRIRVAIRAHDAGHNGVAVCGNSDGGVEGVAQPQIDESAGSCPTVKLPADIGGHHFAVLRERDVDPRLDRARQLLILYLSECGSRETKQNTPHRY